MAACTDIAGFMKLKMTKNLHKAADKMKASEKLNIRIKVQYVKGVSTI